MIDHVSIGVSDIGRAKRFYDAALMPLGYKCLSAGEGSLGYGRGTIAFWISSRCVGKMVMATVLGLSALWQVPARRALAGRGAYAIRALRHLYLGIISGV